MRKVTLAAIVVMIVIVIILGFLVAEQTKEDPLSNPKVCTAYESRFQGITCIKGISRQFDDKELCDSIINNQEFQNYLKDSGNEVFDDEEFLNIEVKKCKDFNIPLPRH